MNTGRHIALIGPAPPFRGGIAQHTALLYRALSEKSPVTLVSYKQLYPRLFFPGKTQFDPSETTLDVPQERLVSPLNPWSWFRTARRLSEAAPHTVIIQWWQPYFGLCLGIIVRLLRRRSDARIVFMCHNVMPHERHWWDELLSRFALSTGDRILVHGDRLRQQMIEKVPGVTCLSHPHPIYDQFRLTGLTKENARSVLRVEGDVLLFFGLVRPYKGLRVLLTALPAIVEQRNVHLVIAGEFYEPEERYRALIQELGLGDHVTIINRYIPNEEVERYFAVCDLVLCPYRSGSQSGVVQIAYSFNKPVICTDVGGLPDSVIDGKTGYVVAPDDPDALANCVLQFYESDQDFSAEIETYKTQFNWRSLAQALTSELD